MKTLISFIAVFAMVSSQPVLGDENVASADVEWKAFSENLVKALKTPNEGLQISAMQRVITYADDLDVDAAVFDIVRLYRMNKEIVSAAWLQQRFTRCSTNGRLGFSEEQ